MIRKNSKLCEEKDSVHVLPLSIIPLQTKGLREARLVKNSRLQGVVELYGDSLSGSGQILPEDLTQHFDFSEDRHADLELVSRLSTLPSYDVYSLRIELRDLGISVEDNSQLKLSESKSQELARFMNMFTRPLVSKIYGGDTTEERSLKDLIGLFLKPNIGSARQKLRELADSMGITIQEIPRFLERYSDVYLSLAYQASILDQISRPIEDLSKSIKMIRADKRFRDGKSIISACTEIEDRLMNATIHFSHVIQDFEGRTRDMWQDISGSRYRQNEQLVLDYHTEISATLCALVVKMDAWTRLSGKSSLSNCVQFIMSEMVAGIESIPRFERLEASVEIQERRFEYIA